MPEVNWDCLYEGLSPEYQQMLAHKVNGLNCSSQPRSWKDGQKPEIPCSQKNPTTGIMNVTCFHSQGNLFPSRKLKGNCTTVEDHENEDDLGPKPDRGKEAKSSAGKEVETTGKVGDVDLLLGYITWFANMVELYQKKNCNCFGCGSLDHMVIDCPRELGKTAWKVGLNLKEGMPKKGDQSSQKLVVAQEATPSISMPRKTPFLNQDPLMHWGGPVNIAWFRIDDEGSWAL